MRLFFIVFGFFIIFAIFFVSPSNAGQQDVFTIVGVEVDKTAENAVVARKLAIEEARQKAFLELVKRVSVSLGGEALPKLGKAQLSSMVKDYEVIHEQRSNTRYLATFKFRFRPDAVKRYLEEQGISIEDRESDPVLVVPFYHDGEKSLLWEEANLWKPVWNKIQENRGLVPVYIPLGDITDMQTAPSDKIISGDADVIEKLMKHYDTKKALIAFVALSDEGAKIHIYEFILGSLHHTQTFLVTPESDKQDILEVAGLQVMTFLQDRWKIQASQSYAQPTAMKIEASVSFSSMGEWLHIQDRLDRVVGIKERKIKTISSERALLSLSFKGSEAKLKTGLSRQGIGLEAPEAPIINLFESNIINVAPVYHLVLKKNKG